MFYLLLLFIALPITELWLLIQIAGVIHWPATILIALGTGALGATLARRQGLATLFRIREQSARGQLPADPVFDGVLILLAGAVLMTPGVLTDALGFSLLVPPVRAVVKRGLRRWFAKNVRIETNLGAAFTQRPAPDEDDIVEGHIVSGRIVEVKTIDPEDPPR